MSKIFYNSSICRSGSSLLQNILGQNPDFYVTPTSGLLELIFAARNNYTYSPEFKAQDADLMKESFLNFCREGMNGYFKSQTDKKYIVDKSRGWGIHYDFLNEIFPNPKILIMVRDLRDVISSMEKIYRKEPHKAKEIINHNKMEGTTVGKRVDYWLSTQPVGLAIERISEILQQGIYKNVLFIKYEDLLTEPDRTMNKIYKYLEVEPFKHDFNHIEQITKEDDEVYGLYGNHTIQNKLDTLKMNYPEILGNDISNYIKNRYKWYFDFFNYK